MLIRNFSLWLLLVTASWRHCLTFSKLFNSFQCMFPTDDNWSVVTLDCKSQLAIAIIAYFTKNKTQSHYHYYQSILFIFVLIFICSSYRKYTYSMTLSQHRGLRRPLHGFPYFNFHLSMIAHCTIMIKMIAWIQSLKEHRSDWIICSSAAIFWILREEQPPGRPVRDQEREVRRRDRGHRRQWRLLPGGRPRNADTFLQGSSGFFHMFYEVSCQIYKCPLTVSYGINVILI